jgi:hypothetical protein
MKLIIMVAFLAGTAALAQQPIASAPSQATTKVRDGAVVHVTSNNDFEYVHLFKAATQRYDDLLLQVTQRNEINFEAEGISGSLKVRAWHMRGSKRGEPMWSFGAAGNEGTALPTMGFYRATSWPCCSAMWVHEYFSLANGAHLYTTNGAASLHDASDDAGLLTITSQAQQNERFIAFGASYAKGHEKPTLQYGTDTKMKQRFELRGHEYGDNFDVPKMELLNDRGQKVTELNGALTFTIVLRFDEADDQPSAELRIPVLDDVIVSQSAVLPKGYSLVELQP